MKNALILTLAIVVAVGALVIIEDNNESVVEKGAETVNETADNVNDAVQGAANEIQ